MVAGFGLLAGEFEGVADVGAVFPDAEEAGFKEVFAGHLAFLGFCLGGFDVKSDELINRYVDGFVGDEGFAVEVGFDCGHGCTFENYSN